MMMIQIHHVMLNIWQLALVPGQWKPCKSLWVDKPELGWWTTDRQRRYEHILECNHCIPGQQYARVFEDAGHPVERSTM